MTSEITNFHHPIIEIRSITKSFRRRDFQNLLVLDQVNFSLNEGEIVALLGKSGSGKSTLLRIIAGLIRSSQGSILYRNQPVIKPLLGVSMVFQSFALFPWLTVLQNVELGLEAQGISRKERRIRALEAIDVIGLDGFESAYPKELSGGMRQRVGFARALVVNPEVLLMDEPFSALDVLTADNLRSDLLDLWQSKKTKIQNILLVTHNIQEAALFADRILVFSSNPGQIRGEIQVNIAHPRAEEDERVRAIVDEVYSLMTTATTQTTGLAEKPRVFNIGYRLPKVGISELTGFLETLNSPEYSPHKVDLPELAADLNLDVDKLFLIIEALELLHFADVSKGDIKLTRAGKQFAEADMLERKQILAAHLLKYVLLARHIRRVLDERPGHRASEDRFLRELEDYLSEDAAEEVLETVINWGRHAELFAYDYNSGVLSLENP